MDKIITFIVSIVLSLAAVFGLSLLTGKPAEPATQSFGALTGPDIQSAYLNWGAGGGVRLWPSSMNFKQATTTLCSFLSPPATSTLQSGGFRLSVGTTTGAMVIDMGKATVPTATTTAIGSTIYLPAGAQSFAQASTSPAAGAATVFAPNTYFNIKIGGPGITAGDTAMTGFVPQGVCHATFEEYSNI